MGAFHVDKTYLVPHRDLLVLAGAAVSGIPLPGGSVELPREIKGPGWVPIRDVQTIRFGERDRLCIVLDYAVVEGAPLMEFSDLEGLPLQIRPP